MREFDFLLRHGYAVLFVLVLIDQLGIPVPAAPFLIAAGAYAASGDLDLVRIAGVSVAASLAAHVFWYEMARRNRGDILGLLCRVSLEPDYCARHARDFFTRWGAGTLLMAAFMPGFIGAAAQPIAATVGMPRRTFLGLNLIGALLWVTLNAGFGFVFSARVEKILQIGAQLGASGLTLIGGLFVLYLGWKFVPETAVSPAANRANFRGRVEAPVGCRGTDVHPRSASCVRVRRGARNDPRRASYCT
jgi:membrane protein DedA with SNARE-associated domain